MTSLIFIKKFSRSRGKFPIGIIYVTCRICGILEMNILIFLTIIFSDSPEPEFLLLKYLALENVISLSIPGIQQIQNTLKSPY